MNRRAGVFAAGIVLATSVVTGSVASAASVEPQPLPRPPTGLSVSLSGGRSPIAPRTSLAYTATLRDNGGHSVRARLVVTTPAYVRIERAPGATMTTTAATWTVTVRPGRSITRTVSATVGAIPAGQLQAATLVSVYAPVGSPTPLIRSVARSYIAGVHLPSATQASGAGAVHGGSGDLATWLVPAGAAAVVLLGGAGFGLVRRRRSRASRVVEFSPPS